MTTLYKFSNGLQLYHEAWGADGEIVEHWGMVGERGESRIHAPPPREPLEAAISAVLAKARSSGFREIEDDRWRTIVIEYSISGMGAPEDLEKRHALEDRMNELLGWTGLGSCDGGSIGSGTMEVFCLVVDSKIAKRVISADLRGPPFGDYSRIFEE